MRIIKEGILPNIEYVFECKTCGCEFAVTGKELFVDNPYLNKNSYKCPVCNTQVFGYKKQTIELEELIGDTGNTGNTNEISES